MKALTIWQPWASLLAMGIKQYETRSWAASYRGPIAIHAAKKDVSDALKMIPAPDALEMSKLIRIEWKALPTGSIIATANLVGCHRIETIGKGLGYWNSIGIATWHSIPEKEQLLGDWTPGRYAWEFSDMRLIDPILTKGKQGLWTWDGME